MRATDRAAPVILLALAALLLPGAPSISEAAPGTAEDPAGGTVRGFRVKVPDRAWITHGPRDSRADPANPGSRTSRLGSLVGPAVVSSLDGRPLPPSTGHGDAAGKSPTAGRQQVTEAQEPPPRDKVGGFQFGLLGGVQLVGSASGQGGVTLGYFKPSTAAIGLEAEAGITLGPNGEVYHGLLSIVLQSGARSSRIVPYLSLGGGVFRAEVDLRDAVEEELPNFGIDLPDSEEEGPLIAVGLGVRYYLSDWLSLRLDYREFRALTQVDSDFLDRLFALRRIGGMLSLEF